MPSHNPDFLHELDVRRHAIFNITLLVVGATVLIVITAIIMGRMPGEVLQSDHTKWIVGGMALVILLNVIFVGVFFVPLAVRGGTYRVVIQGGELRVESPSSWFGQSFEVPLSDISRLVNRKDHDGRVTHEVHTTNGQVFVLDANFSGKHHIPATDLYDVIQRLNPRIQAMSEGN